MPPPAGDERRVGDVVDDLTRIIERSRREPTRLAVFPSMYRTVTRTVADGLAEGYFGDAARVERLVVTFADLYIDAVDAWLAGRRPPVSWELAFAFASRPRGSILQHLLLGMNAHINLDLGVATAAVTSVEDRAGLRDDFDRVNGVLFALLDALQGELDDLSPWMGRVDRWGLGFDEACMRLGIRTARDDAWEFAGALVESDAAQRTGLTVARDERTRRAGRFLCHGLSPVHLANRVIARRECRDLSRIVDDLSAVRIDLGRVDGGPAPRGIGSAGNTPGPGAP